MSYQPIDNYEDELFEEQVAFPLCGRGEIAIKSPPFSHRFNQKLAVQERYNQKVFLAVILRSLQGIAERPLPCNYNVIQPDSALSRR
jgi:hypothetical protein